MRNEKIPSEFDGLKLEVAIATPVEIPKGIIQFSHGMAEHKERYFDFMELSHQSWICLRDSRSPWPWRKCGNGR